MRFYFCTESERFGNGMILYPRVPDTIDPENEDGEIKRICVSSSIIGCLSAIGHCIGINSKVNIYYCDITDLSILHQPKAKEVADVEYTGEFWLLKEQEFKFLRSIRVKNNKSFYIKNGRLHLIEFEEIN